MSRHKTNQGLAEHMFLGCDGSLHDTRDPQWAGKPLRERYAFTFNRIDTVSKLKATLRNGPYAWPGGYPMFFVTSDGACLSFDSVKDNLESIMRSVRDGCSDGWNVVACDVNWETDMLCEHSGESIESAYGEK